MSSMETSLNPPGPLAIDRSLKAPLLVLIFSGLGWLMLTSIIGYIAAWKLHNPEFLNGSACLTIGRVQAVYMASLVYGFGCNLAFGAGLWLMARLSGSELRHGWYLIIAAVFWNLALTIGVVGIFMGHMQAFQFLELPSYVALPMLLASLVISLWGIMLFKHRAHADVYASQWFLLAAFLVFPWIQIVSQIMLVANPVPGVVQALVASWFGNNLLWLWFGGIAVAALYYLIPKILGKRLLAYSLAQFGFCVLVFAGSWMGAARLIGGPFPAWVVTSGIVASILMMIFFAITGINFVGTYWQNRNAFSQNDVLLFAGFAAVALLIAGIGSTLMSLRSVAEVTQFTILLDAHQFLVLYGVFGMTMFAVVYHALPKILGRDWPMDFLVSTHFWISFVGILLLVLPLALGGWKQGIGMNDASVPLSDVIRHTSYWMVGRSMAWIFLTIGHLAFILNILLILKPDCESCIEGLTRTEPDPIGGTES